MKKKYDLNSQLEALKCLGSYSFTEESNIDEIGSRAVIMKHKKTGARVFLLLNDDENKVFTIGFRTPSRDSTGVAHIIEHTVLCGSEKFPSKDPFVELAKGSLNTFLNAMTYPDKTVYPVASCNDKDFHNLCDVYLNSVFYPNIYKEEKIFRQEGWHYELENADAELKINGVVYNEMKGAYSSADGVLERAANKVLFEGHSYGEESGGDPMHIPELSYESFLDFHSRYYHPSNSFIYLYGDMNMAEKLEWMDREYLSKFDYREVDSKIRPVAPWSEPRFETVEYSISDTEDEENSGYLSLHTVTGGELEPVKYMGFQILDYLLLDVPGAALREALSEAGIGEDVSGGFEYGISEPYFSVIAKNVREDQRGEFMAVIKGTLRKLANAGIDRDSVMAAINISEFRAREADYGSYPRGLMYGLESFNSWLYDADPAMHLRFQGVFDELKKRADEGFFENLIKDYLLDNPYEALIYMKPVKGLTAINDEKLAKELAQIKAGLNDEELQKIVRETEELKEYQKTPSTKEELDRIPLLGREDIDKEAEKLIWEKRSLRLGERELPVIFSDIFTSKIAYIKLMFNVNFADGEELPYISFLKEVLGYIDTDRHSYSGLATETNLNSGGVGFNLDSYLNIKEPDKSNYSFSVNGKVLYDKTGWFFTSAAEMLTGSRLDDKKRLKEILLEVKARTKSRLVSSGHISALTRAGSAISKDMFFNDATKGIRYYEFLERISSDFDNKADELSARLISLSERIFTLDNMLIDIICDSEGFEHFDKAAIEPLGALKSCAERGKGFEIERKYIKEAFSTASRVNYVARFGNFRDHGFSYRGELKILKVLLSYDYLWNNIRVLGGAYGCSATFGQSGNAGFTSYRDPNLSATNRIYSAIPDFIENFDADEREMTKAIIGAIGEMDTPLTPLTKGLRGLAAYIQGVTDEDMQKERDEILNATPESIRSLKSLVEAALSDEIIVAIGNEEQIKAEADEFDITESLYQ